METTEIILEVLRIEGLNPKRFAESIGVLPVQIYELKSGRLKKISEAIADKILKKYRKYRKSWLMTGEGTPFIDDASPLSLNDPMHLYENSKLLEQIVCSSESIKIQAEKILNLQNEIDLKTKKLLKELGHEDVINKDEVISIFGDEIRRLQVEIDMMNEPLEISSLEMRIESK